jgi:hypothetical protein
VVTCCRVGVFWGEEGGLAKEPRVSCVLSECSSTECHLQPPIAVLINVTKRLKVRCFRGLLSYSCARNYQPLKCTQRSTFHLFLYECGPTAHEYNTRGSVTQMHEGLCLENICQVTVAHPCNPSYSGDKRSG